MKNSLRKLLISALSSMSFMPFLVFGDELPFAETPKATGPISSPQGIIDLVNNVLFWTATIFWIAAAGFVLYAAYIYLTAGGDAERVNKAHKQLLWAVVAIAVGLMARGLPFLIYTFLGGK